MKVFILAHQDDEVFLLPHIINSEKKLFIYLTNGVSTGSSISKLDMRTIEAESIFENHLEVLNSQVIWWGLEKLVPEGELYKFTTEKNIRSIEELIRHQSEIVTQILTTTFEGAHQDHDAAAIISLKLTKNFLVDAIEVSTYPQWFTKVYSFRVLRPQHPASTFKFDRKKTIKLALRLMAGYKSQRATWLGLGPATIAAYTFRQYRSSRPMPVGEIRPCFYESRDRASQNEVLQFLTSSSSH